MNRLGPLLIIDIGLTIENYTGAACAGAAAVLYQRRRTVTVPSSPHYLSAKQQNHYVSMGSLDWKKTSPLSSGGDIIGGVPVSAAALLSTTTTANKNSAMAGKINNTDYPTATIKRNSHVNGQLRANIEADNIF